MSRSYRFVLILFLLVPSSGMPFAQEKVRVESFEGEAKLVAVRQGALQVRIKEQAWLVAIDSPEFGLESRTRMELKATARRSFLKPGMNVRFEAMFDKAGRRVVEPIEELIIFSPSPDTRYGVFPNDVAKAEGKRFEGGGPFGERRQRERPRPEGGAMYVIGQLARIRDGELAVQVPGKSFSVQLAKDAKIDLHVTDKKMVVGMLNPGDTIRIRGFYKEPPRLYAQQISLAMKEPLGEAPQGEGIAKVPSRLPRDGDTEKPGDVGERPPRENPFALPDDVPRRDDRGEKKPRRARILKVN